MPVDAGVDRRVLVTARDVGPVRVLTLNRPERHNALVPELLAALGDALSDVDDSTVGAVVLAGAGRSFSTGGDVAAFATHEGEQLREYARRTVGLLHEVVLDLLRCDRPVVAAVHGPVTGGSLGLVLGSDLVVMSPSAWIAPYYVDVGFGPDGGWTALLPGRVGPARALSWQLLNHRVSAQEALDAGLATHVDDDPLGRAIALATTMAGKKPRTVRSTKRLVRGDLTATRAALDAELENFVDLVDTDETARGMRDFLS